MRSGRRQDTHKMPYNEADTRAKLIDPALHARQWIELVKDEQRATHGEIHREQSAVRIEKTSIAVGVLQRLSDGGQLKRYLPIPRHS